MGSPDTGNGNLIGGLDFYFSFGMVRGDLGVPYFLDFFVIVQRVWNSGVPSSVPRALDTKHGRRLFFETRSFCSVMSFLFLIYYSVLLACSVYLVILLKILTSVPMFCAPLFSVVKRCCDWVWGLIFFVFCFLHSYFVFAFLALGVIFLSIRLLLLSLMSDCLLTAHA